MPTHECPVLSGPNGAYSNLGEIRNTTRRIRALGELMQCFSSTNGLTADEADIVQTLLNDLEDGAKRTEALFDAGHRH